MEKFTPIYRIWHWLMAFSVLGLLATVLLRKTFLSWRSNSEIIQVQLAQLGSDITAHSAQVVAKAIRAPMWEWHYIFAVVLGLSIALRLYMVLSRQVELPILSIKKAEGVHKLKAITHTLLCLSVAIMAVGGTLLYFSDFLGFSKSAADTIKDFHEFMMKPLILFVVMHLAGVLRHEFVTKEGIVSKMIHGER